MAISEQLKDLASVIAGQLNAGSPAARQSLELGGGGIAWGWTGGMIRTVANYATPATSTGMSFPITRVSEIAAATVVAPTAPKPVTAGVAKSTENLKKFSGAGVATLEQHLDASNLAAAIASVIGASALKAFETDAITVLDAGAGQTVTTATDWVSGVATAQAQLLGEGAQPSVLVISALDYAAFLADVLATAAFNTSPDSAVGQILGSPIHVSPSAPAGKAWVFDSAAVVCAQHQSSPLVIVDVVSKAITNQTQFVVDLVAGTFVTHPPGVVEITAPAAAMSAGHAKRK